jgi:hypothetical protein
MEKNGWIKLHRKMLDNPIIMKDAEHLAVWMYLLLNATHAEYPALFKGKKIMLQPGQLITGCISIGNQLSISESKVRRTLNDFISDGQIDRQTSNKNSLITVLNWDLYQNFDGQNSSQVTDNRRTTDGQLTTNKKNKNVKNDKNVIIYSDIPELNNTILEFIKFRKSIKKPMTDNAVKLLLGKLNKMTSNTSEQIEILNQSIMNGWTSIYPLKKDNAKKEVVPGWLHQQKHGFKSNDYDNEQLEKDLLANDADFAREAEELKKMLQEKY